MTQFRTLPVRRGDAFLLQSRRGDYLVDGGAPGCGLPEMLADRKVRKIRSVICSTAGPDRIGGVIDLLRSGFTPREIWYPESLETMVEAARCFNGDWSGWVRCVTGNDLAANVKPESWPLASIAAQDAVQRRLCGATGLLLLAMSTCLGDPPCLGASLAHGTVRHILEPLVTGLAQRCASGERAVPYGGLSHLGWQLLQAGSEVELILLCARLLRENVECMPGKSARKTKELVASLAMTAEFAALLTTVNSRIRLFRNTGRMEEQLVPRHPMQCINGIAVAPDAVRHVPPTPESILRLARSLHNRKRSLVFRYGDRHCGVLFCSDTRLRFLERHPLMVDRPTVITAPRQGNVACAQAYERILTVNGADVIWVRAHSPGSRKIAEEFKQQTIPLCLTGCTTYATQEILLQATPMGWHPLSGGRCTCPPRAGSRRPSSPPSMLW